MAKAKVYLKSGQCFDVAAEKIACKYNTITGELTSFKYEGATEFPIYLDVSQVAAVVQLLGNESGGVDDAESVPIVRCKNCLYWVSGSNECESWEWCKMLNTDMPPNGFCYLGDRKDDDDDKTD